MQIRIRPPAGWVDADAGCDADIHAGSNAPDMRQYLAIQFFFGSRTLPAQTLPGRFLLVLVIKPKGHRSQYDIETLCENVIMRTHFSNIFRRKEDIRGTELFT